MVLDCFIQISPDQISPQLHFNTTSVSSDGETTSSNQLSQYTFSVYISQSILISCFYIQELCDLRGVLKILNLLRDVFNFGGYFLLLCHSINQLIHIVLYYTLPLLSILYWTIFKPSYD